MERILKNFSMLSCKLRLTSLLVRISLSTNNLLTNEKEIAEMKKVLLLRGLRVTNVVIGGHPT